MLFVLLVLTVPVTISAVLYARWEYRRRGKLSVMGIDAHLRHVIRA